jgi:hypothetical protein
MLALKAATWSNCEAAGSFQRPEPRVLVTAGFAANTFIYFDAGTYSGGNGLPEWLMASLGVQSQNQPGGRFARSPMDAYAQAR